MTEVCVTEDKTSVVVAASYRSVSRNPVRCKALFKIVAVSRGQCFAAVAIFPLARAYPEPSKLQIFTYKLVSWICY